MRVVAGRLGGRRLVAPPGLRTRPATDRVRESLFSALGDAVAGAAVLDLYAGAGTLGIEAASRGAASVVFVESDRGALDALRANLASLGVEASVVGRPVEAYLASATGPFDLVFCDPPWDFSTAAVERVLSAVAAILAEGGVVVVSRRASDPRPIAPGLELAADRRLGDTRITRYRRRQEPT